jgi:hypothetical protein
MAASGTGHIGGFGVKFLSGDYHPVVCTALGFVTRNNVTMAEMTEVGRYELSFPGLQRSVGTETADSEHLAVNESGLTMIASLRPMPNADTYALVYCLLLPKPFEHALFCLVGTPVI